MVHQDHVRTAFCKCLHHDLDKQTVSKAKAALFQKCYREIMSQGFQKKAIH